MTDEATGNTAWVEFRGWFTGDNGEKMLPLFVLHGLVGKHPVLVNNGSYGPQTLRENGIDVPPYE